jgi:hypothetical protein
MFKAWRATKRAQKRVAKYGGTPLLIIKTIEGRRRAGAEPALTGDERAAAVRRLKAERGLPDTDQRYA